MAEPPRRSRGQAARLFVVSTVLLSGCGLAAAVVSPAERTIASPAAAEVATDAPALGAERVAAAPSTTTTTTTSLPPSRPEIVDAYSVRVDDAIVYGRGDTTAGPIDLVLDLYVPVAADGRDRIAGQPAAVLVHGGGFTQGSRTNAGLPELATTLASHGIVTVSIDHRLAGDEPIVTTAALTAYFDGLDPATVSDWLAETDVVAAAIEDTVLAAEWLLELGVDPDRVVLGGSSAGAIASLYAAHLGDDAGLAAPGIAAVISLWGGYTVTPGLAEPLDAGDAPIWIAHGTADPIVPYEYASVIAWRGGSVGVDVVVHGLDGVGHGFPAIDLWSDRAASGVVLIDDLVDFLRLHA
ncbi:MAG: alpha/beta hydrolase [Actinomycetota bacterium]